MSANARELIVLAAPSSGDPYYAEVADKIFEFHVAYANAIGGKDDVLILTDNGGFARYAGALGKERVAKVPMLDIWMRDFGTCQPAKPMMFRYTAEGQAGQGGQRAADEVQEALALLLEEAGLEFRESDLLNDGGNFVGDGAGRAVLSKKFLRDNDLTEEEARAVLRKAAGLEHVAFIEADEQGGLEHADGVVAFLDEGVLAINTYPKDGELGEYAKALRADLERGLPGVKIHEIPTPYDGTEIHDEKFGSACGLYINMLVTPGRIYLPQFGTADDRVALDKVRSLTDKEVIPVPSAGVCSMGGGVRCMSWQVRGANAKRLRAHFQ